MDFLTAEEKFKELNARIRRGEALSEDQYQEELAKLMVQDEGGVFWSLEPGTGHWLYFDGTEWVPGNPPKPTAPPAPPTTEPVMEAPTQPSYEYEPRADVTTEMPSTTGYAAETDFGRSADYRTSYTEPLSYATEPSSTLPSYQPTGLNQPPAIEPEGMTTYVRVPEGEPPGAQTGGGIPPRPVRGSSPLAPPIEGRAWLPFAFGALVLFLCAVILFFGVRGLPQFSGAAALPTEEPTEVVQVLPTATVELEPTAEPEPTEAPPPTEEPTPVPQPVSATTTDVLNIREGPDRTTKSLGKLQQGTTVTVVGRNADNSWLHIQIPESTNTGWVSAQFVTVTGDLNSLPIIEGGTAPAQPTETPTG